MVFGTMVMIIEVVAIIEEVKGRFGTFLTLLNLALVVWLFSKCLHIRSCQYRRKADEISNERY